VVTMPFTSGTLRSSSGDQETERGRKEQVDYVESSTCFGEYPSGKRGCEAGLFLHLMDVFLPMWVIREL
jgi:hypothetical protein